MTLSVHELLGEGLVVLLLKNTGRQEVSIDKSIWQKDAALSNLEDHVTIGPC